MTEEINPTGRAKHVAEMIGISVSQVWRLMDSEPDFPQPFRLGGSTLFDLPAVAKWVEQKKQAADPYRKRKRNTAQSA